MSQQSWERIYRLSGVVLLLAIMGLVLQVQYLGWMPIVVTVVISGLKIGTSRRMPSCLGQA